MSRDVSLGKKALRVLLSGALVLSLGGCIRNTQNQNVTNTKQPIAVTEPKIERPNSPVMSPQLGTYTTPQYISIRNYGEGEIYNRW